MDVFNNIMCLTDSYKTSHYRLYPPKCEKIYSYFECRGGKFPSTIFFGLQYILKKYLTGKVVTEEKILYARKIIDLHMGPNVFNEDAWRYILEVIGANFLHLVKKHNGFLPVLIKAVPEGSLIPVKNVLLTVENTDPKCFWLSNYLETLLVEVWYPMTVATISFYQKKIIASYLNKTSDCIDGLVFKLHDFGFRGVSSVESAALGGCAHLLNFRGTDTLISLIMALEYYNCPNAAFSIPATEHSNIITWTKEGEVDSYSNVLAKYPTGMVACVSDSYDIFNACSYIWGELLKDKVLARDGILIIRPDSGNPSEIVPKLLDILGSKFGFEINSKGFKMLPSAVRLIQGDGISYDTLDTILASIAKAGWSIDNVSFGSGGALLQKMDRDTQKCAFKCSAATIEGKIIDVYKDPITDHSKRSKRGLLSLELDELTQQLHTIEGGNGDSEKDLLRPVFYNGEILIDETLDQIRDRIEKQIDFSQL